jgi:ribosomal protein L4
VGSTRRAGMAHRPLFSGYLIVRGPRPSYNINKEQHQMALRSTILKTKNKVKNTVVVEIYSITPKKFTMLRKFTVEHEYEGTNVIARLIQLKLEHDKLSEEIMLKIKDVESWLDVEDAE